MAVAVATVVVEVTADVATVVVDLEKETRLTAHAGGATEMENQASPITLQATKGAPIIRSAAPTLILTTYLQKRNTTLL